MPEAETRDQDHFTLDSKPLHLSGEMLCHDVSY